MWRSSFNALVVCAIPCVVYFCATAIVGAAGRRKVSGFLPKRNGHFDACREDAGITIEGKLVSRKLMSEALRQCSFKLISVGQIGAGMEKSAIIHYALSKTCLVLRIVYAYLGDGPKLTVPRENVSQIHTLGYRLFNVFYKEHEAAQESCVGRECQGQANMLKLLKIGWNCYASANKLSFPSSMTDALQSIKFGISLAKQSDLEKFLVG